ncbi:MAG: hypothetical protein AB7F25_07280 [Deferribacterales bacterium]
MKYDITRFRESVTDMLAGELSEKDSAGLIAAMKRDVTFAQEYRLMNKAWEDVASEEYQTPPMSDRLAQFVFGGELTEDDLDMVSGGIGQDPLPDEDDDK